MSKAHGQEPDSFADRLQRDWITDGPLAQLFRPLAGLYGALLSLRALLYRRNYMHTGKLSVPVVVVGNWIVGGAGKTPTTLALLAHFKKLGLQAGVVSRGYGRNGEGICLVTADHSAAEVGDEPLLIHLRSGAPVAVGQDRVAVAQALLDAHPQLQLLISDDGLQHLRLPRQLSVLLFDERGLGNGRLLPAGPLRQRPTQHLQAHELVLYNAPTPSTALPGFLAKRSLAGAVGLQAWWQGQAATVQTLHDLRCRHLLAAAGMAHPQRFFDMLKAEGLSFQALPLPDHFDFKELPWPADTPDVLLTEKDAVKLTPQRCAGTRVWVVALDFQPELAFWQALESHLHALKLLPKRLPQDIKNG
ncbi:tetraacyldisaccharide 4'-kinase [Paucibacter sp. Y2R2-4]|uniref:tetraacyldisaccharide 4'-kinase n=1 Tax=Paucibacter sp. Y2R2-4 TaxID=2893553 RepID=UPI0021E497F7|nr:tetraacyldisaccharide 4'-kinase [Paucibacter sp. Y2R2-4]MCV2348887.1 tetraacyldisaccharide 4'-kinase [Paucibacter sp. Y2R2-4]